MCKNSVFFTEKFNVYLISSVPSFSNSTLSSHPPPIMNNSSFSFHNICLNDLSIILMSIKSNSVGLDNLSIMYLKMLFPIIAPFILHIFNFCLSSSTFPKSWKQARVIPVHKNTRSCELKDFRPISILPVLSKAMEIVLKNQISDYFNRDSEKTIAPHLLS